MVKRWSLFAAMSILMLVLAACSDSDDESVKTEDSKLTIALVGDTVSKLGGCVLASQFAEGDDIIFRMNATNAETGEQLTEADVKVHLSTGEVLDMEYGPHGEDNFWVTKYSITADTPKGQLNYYVTAEYDGVKGEYKPFNVAPSLITIIDASGATPTTEEPELEPVNTTNANIQQEFKLFGENFEFKNEAGEKIFFVKAGEEVTIDYVNQEGIHGFDIKGLDVSVKEAGKVTFTPNEAGEYDIVCNVFCGADHESMISKLVVVE